MVKNLLRTAAEAERSDNAADLVIELQVPQQIQEFVLQLKTEGEVVQDCQESRRVRRIVARRVTAKETQKGAKAGIEYANKWGTKPLKMAKINDYEWLEEYYNETIN